MERWAAIKARTIYFVPTPLAAPGVYRVQLYPPPKDSPDAGQETAASAWYLWSGIDNTGTAFEHPEGRPQAQPLTWSAGGYTDVYRVENCNSFGVYRVRRELVAGLELRGGTWLVPIGAPEHVFVAGSTDQNPVCKCGVTTAQAQTWPVCGPWYARESVASEGRQLARELRAVMPLPEHLRHMRLERDACPGGWDEFVRVRDALDHADEAYRRARELAHLARLACLVDGRGDGPCLF